MDLLHLQSRDSGKQHIMAFVNLSSPLQDPSHTAVTVREWGHVVGSSHTSSAERNGLGGSRLVLECKAWCLGEALDLQHASCSCCNLGYLSAVEDESVLQAQGRALDSEAYGGCSSFCDSGLLSTELRRSPCRIHSLGRA